MITHWPLGNVVIFKLVNELISSTSCEILARWKLKNSFDDMSKLVQVMAGHQQAINHCLSQSWPRFGRHMVSLGHNESKPISLVSVPKLTYVYNSIQFTVTYPSFTHSSGANCPTRKFYISSMITLLLVISDIIRIILHHSLHVYLYIVCKDYKRKWQLRMATISILDFD